MLALFVIFSIYSIYYIPLSVGLTGENVKINHKYKNAIEKVHTIKSDFKRDCKSWYKFDSLTYDLFELQDQFEATVKELARANLINLKYQGKCKCEIDFGDIDDL